MKVVHIFKQAPTATEADILAVHKAEHDVTVVNLYQSADYDKVVEAIEKSDRVFTW